MICCEGPIDSGGMQLGALPDDRRWSSSPQNKISRGKKANLQSASFHAANLICGRWLGYLLSPASDMDRLMLVSRWLVLKFGFVQQRRYVFIPVRRCVWRQDMWLFWETAERRLRNNSPVSCTRLFNDLGSLECFKTWASVFSADPENSSSCGDTHTEDPLNADYF